VINFRYHIVSLTAVFLALAIGLVVGTAALNGPASEYLNDEVKRISKQNDALRDEVNLLKDEAQQEEKFAAEALPYLIGDRLAGRRVLLMTTADADKEYVDGVLKDFEVAKVKVTGRITVQKKFIEPASKESLLELVDLSTPPGINGLPANSNGVETSAALLAAVLVDRTPAVTADDRRKVIAAYRDYIVPTPEVTGPAEAVVLLTGAPYAEKDDAKLNGALKFLVEQFDKAGALVVAGNGTGGEGNLVAAVRGDAALTKVSTVDNIASPQGRAAALLALAEQVEGKAGAYGIGDGATALIPKPAAARNGS
jgi:hypothetical protein